MTNASRERIRAALERRDRIGNSFPTTPTSARSADGRTPVVARVVFPPMTLEDDDAVRATWEKLPTWSTYEEAMRALLEEP